MRRIKKKKRYIYNKSDHLVLVGEETGDKEEARFLHLNSFLVP